ncbi:MAG: response regulator [Anaerolineales bacterium]
MTGDSDSAKENTALVRDALAHLYDYPYLQKHPLADQLGIEDQLPPRERMRRLRIALIEAIEQLKPLDETSARSPKSRSYQVLNLHYVESMLIEEVARELCISVRQTYRDLRKAEEDLTAILGLDAVDESGQRGVEVMADGSGLADEFARVADSSRDSSPLAEIVVEVADVVQALADLRGVQLKVSVDGTGDEHRLLATELARQAITSLASLSIQSAVPGSVLHMRPIATDQRLYVEILLCCDLPFQHQQLDTARKLLAMADGDLAISIVANRCTLRASWPIARKKRVLLVDDNAELATMFERFLQDTPYELAIARDAIEGFFLASAKNIDLVVLDVMMPGRNGWSLLQRLANNVTTRDLPVIVCSVIHDPELAASLGAVASLAKPVSRTSLLITLDEVVRSRHQRVAWPQ